MGNDDVAGRRQNRKARRGSILYTPQSNSKGHGGRMMNTPGMLGWTGTGRRTPLSRRKPMSQIALAQMYEKVLTKVQKNTINKKMHGIFRFAPMLLNWSIWRKIIF